jgi:aspartyl/asparaginyl beta-hydroxylase (cupin superfamily)
MAKLWYSLFDEDDYKGSEPSFFEPDNYFFSEIIKSNFSVIEKELVEYLKSHQLQSYFNETMVSKKNSWKTIALKAWNVELYENHHFFPKTLQIINSIPSLVSASFNLLEPKGHIVPHCGDTNGIFRCHLGLSIPAEIPTCGFRVKDEWRSWKNGELLVFVDANNHEAINLSDNNRFIFLFDIVREEYIEKKHIICATVLTALFMQKIAQKLNVVHKPPFFIQNIIAKFFIPLAYIAIPIRNFLYKK